MSLIMSFLSAFSSLADSSPLSRSLRFFSAANLYTFSPLTALITHHQVETIHPAPGEGLGAWVASWRGGGSGGGGRKEPVTVVSGGEGGGCASAKRVVEEGEHGGRPRGMC